MGKKKTGDVSYISTDSTGDSSSDDAELISSESSSGRTRKYVVSVRESQSVCTKKLSRNERLCLVFGGIVLAVVVIIFIIVAVSVNKTGSTQDGGEPWKNVRLPANIVPDQYEVSLIVDLESFNVTGEVTVNTEVVSETPYVLIHAKDMNITGAQVSQGGSTVGIKSAFSFTENDFYVMELSTALKTGPLDIHITFNYTLTDDLAGFYRSSYVKQSTGERRWLATTQFQPTDARRAFPCFDEPALKANFTVQITHDAQYEQVVSNMPVESRASSSSGSNTVITRFKTSVKMSTYLVAFIVSDFECVNSSTDSGIMVRVCSNPDVVDKTTYALKVATTVLAFYETFYGVPYPLEKQDLFAIPDFAIGAMENWGLITYREGALLYDSQTNPATSRQGVADVIAHELAHQWFGNLVTMAWWDDLWLNEGFATFVEYIGTDEAQPEFRMMDQFYIGDLSRALWADGLNESHPIVQAVSNPDEINSIFDSISYSKGSSIIRMLQHYLTESVFRNGVKHYLSEHKFANAETHQLWEALQEKVTVHKDYTVSEIMDTWTKQTGYPVVTFSRSTNTVTQTRFFANGKPDILAPSAFNYTWIIPFDYTTDQSGGEIAHSVILKDEHTTLRLPAGVRWVKADVGETGFYRVNYEAENWRALTQHLMENPDSALLPPVDRAGLLDDAFALSSASLLDTVTALKLAWYLRKEREYVPWRAAIKWISTLARRLSLTPLFGSYRRFVLDLTQSAVSELGFDQQNLTHLQTFLRTDLLGAAWRFGHLEVINTGRALFQEWKETGIIDPILKDMVYQVGVAYGSEEDWNYVWQWYNTTDDPYEKRLCLRALAQSREPWILSRYLNYSITKVRTQDTLSVVELVSDNVNGRFLAWNFARNNWDYFSEVYGGGFFSFSGLIRTITLAFSTELELREVESFFNELPNLGSGARATRQAIEAIRRNISWLEANLGSLEKCLENTQRCFAGDE